MAIFNSYVKLPEDPEGMFVEILRLFLELL